MGSLAKLLPKLHPHLSRCTKSTLSPQSVQVQPLTISQNKILTLPGWIDSGLLLNRLSYSYVVPVHALSTLCSKSGHVIVPHSHNTTRRSNISSSFCHLLLPRTSCNCTSIRNSGNRKPLVAQFSEDIDIEKLKLELRQERKEGSQVQLSQKIWEAVQTKCDEAIKNLSEEQQKQLKVLQLEHSFLYSEGHDILRPEEMTSEHWLEALALSSKLGRLKYYLFLQKRIYLKESQKAKRGKKEPAAAVTETGDSNIYEHGRLFMRIYESTMRKWLSYRLASSMQFGIPLVFDMDFEEHMKPVDIRNTASQLVDVYAYNRKDEGTPFHLHLLNCPQENAIHKVFQIFLQDMPDIMMTVSEKSYLDHFDKKDLIYLSPNGRQVMRRFDPTAVYIVGAFNDKSTNRPITYAKAKEQGIRCQRLPLDEHLNWLQGRKDLTLDQVMRILLAVKNKEPWKSAFKHIPKRKLVQNVD